MADSILRLKVESQEYDNKLKQATNGLTRYADECRKVGGTREVVEKETLDYVRALGQMDTTSRTATGKLAEMKKTFVELSAQYKQMSDAEKNAPFGKALAASLDQLKVRIQDSKSQLDDINKSINGGGGLSGALDAVAGKFGLSIDQVTKFGGVVGVATTAIQVAKDAFFQSESGIDEWGRTVEGAKGAYSIFLDTLNNGNWSNFFQNLAAAIQGGRDLYDVFDRLGSIKSNNAAAIALVQQEISELRLAKQQGENVDAKLKSATERLAILQKQGVTAGLNAGNMSAFQTIRNGVNSIGGANVNDATINYVVERIMKNGQSEFDKYHRNFQILQQKGTRTTVIPIDDGMGGTVNKYQSSFDINLLTKEQQKQYALAKAVTEGETRIQKGIATYAQAVQEGAASAREQFKGNRYALQGSGGSGGKGGNTTITEEKDEFTEIIGLVENAQERVSDLQRQISESWDEGEIARLTGELKVAQTELQRLKDIGKEKPMQQGLSGFNQQTMSAWMQGRQGDLAKAEYGSADYSSIMGNIADMNTIKTILEQSMKAGINAAQFDLSGLWEKVFDGDDIPDATWQAMVNKINEKLKEMKLEPISIEFKTGEIAKDGKIIKSSYKDAASAVNSLGSALSGLDDPGAKIAGTIAQAIANIALAFSSADLKEGESGNIWYWIAATAAGMATMISTISAIHSATGYQNGGVVKGYQRGGVVKGYAGGKPVMGYAGGGSIGSAISGGMITGSTYSNDQIPIMANAGEVVLTNAMTTTLASKLNDQGNTGYVPSHISGEQIYIALNRFMRRSGRGEIVTWKS